GQAFTKDEAVEGAGINACTFDNIKSLFLAQYIDKYEITSDGLFRYLSYEATVSAEKNSNNALLAAGLAILISAGSLIYASNPIGSTENDPLYSKITNLELVTSPNPAEVKINSIQMSDFNNKLNALIKAVECINPKPKGAEGLGGSDC
ncbi:MAG: hypothetical protein R8K20_08590, partial [Gallionellaceae bacterium]